MFKIPTRKRPDAAQVLAELLALHAEVDAQTAKLVERLPKLTCASGCAGCCLDELTVFRLEALAIQDRYGAQFATWSAGPVGACAFLDEHNACRVYERRPYVCRTQGLPLRWVEQLELRDICELNAHVALSALPEEDCWTLGEVEGRLATLQVLLDGAPTRVALRGLLGE